MATRNEAAVIVERACKFYGKKDRPILDNLNMTVERGTIYGLLGPSGCGKTTLLSCIVGRRKLNSGDVWVLGGKPGEKGSGVPGPRVGYMPQEIALVREFSVRDAVYYFGRIYGMKPKLLSERYEFLRTLLDLPSGRRLIKTLSGGQQRRVSLAAALVHDPELLILDEPTVGLDPVLRERIWEFLVEQARKGTSVIITTHYIDETKQADKIGLLRDGQFLAEASPSEILSQFECDTLEEAFFKLATRQHENRIRRPSRLPSTSPDVIPDTSIVNAVESRCQSREDFNIVTSSTDVLTKNEKLKDCDDTRRSRYKAVFLKNLQQFGRHPGGLIFSLMFPIIQVVAFFSAIGHNPYDLHLAVVNDEAANSPYGLDICKRMNESYATFDSDEYCHMHMASCWFINGMVENELHQVPYNTTEEAKNQVFLGKYYGALHFPHNFSESFSTRLRDGTNDDDDVIENSTISVWMDMTDHQVSNWVKKQLYTTYENFVKRAMKACNREERVGQLPVNFVEPISGQKNPRFVEYCAPGVMVTIIFFLATLVTSTLMIMDRLEGVWERSAVAGVRPQEMLQVHIALQSLVILLQTLEMMVLAFALYQLPTKGSLLACGVLLFLQGLGGMCYGFALSVWCPSYTVSFFVSTGSFYPMIILCGILWPIEGMPIGLRYFSYLLPFTIPITTLRDLMQKGTSISDPSIYNGFLVTIGWIVGLLILCFIRLRFKRD